MDLAEIRKKAKNRKDTAGAPAGTETETSLRPTPSIQGVPAEAAAMPGEQVDGSILPGPGTEEEGGDPLDKLFRWNPELELPSEESYLQGVDNGHSAIDGETRHLLTFSLGNEEYALDIEQIREIIKPREITDIPRVPPFVLGIVSLRGIIVPIYDLKQRLKLGRVEVAAESRIIVCQEEERIVGLLVDRITQVVRLQDRNLEPPPNVLSGIDRDFVSGVGRFQGRMMILLHLASVLNAELL